MNIAIILDGEENTNFRVSRSRHEILNFLNKKLHTDGKLLVWQKKPGSEERDFITEAEFKNIDMVDGVITLEINQDQKSFNREYDTFFLLKDQNIAFKAKLAIHQPNSSHTICFQSPREIRLTELRSTPRVYFDDQSYKIAKVVFQNKIEKGKPILVDCKIFNISKQGICLVISKETLSLIDLKSKIHLSDLGFYEKIENHKQAFVKNARVFSKKTLNSDESYAIGLEFLSEN